MEIDEVFDANPISIERLLREPGQCFYIPAYQRPYSWDATHINRLFDDTGHGVAELLKSPDAITFLGTIITIHDTQYTTVDPKVADQLPPRVMTVIDGQQRLTTLLILIAAIHDELTVRHARLAKSDHEDDKWLANKALETYSILGKTLEDDRDFGDHRYYPRMARAYEDKWSRWANQLTYGSPIAEFLFRFGEHKRVSPTKSYTHVGDAVMKSRFALMKRLLKASIAKSDGNDDVQFPSNHDLAHSVSIAPALFQGNLPEGVRAKLIADEDNAYMELFRLLVFARFILQRVAVTIVVAKSEEYAFDMFEALNTTGEPLTAIETFKPRVIQAEGHVNYEGSDSHKSMNDIEGYLSRFKTAPARQTATADLLIPFALAESGVKLSKRLNDQRRFLMSRYDALGPDIAGRREFLRHLARTARVVDRAWKPESGVPELPPISFTTDARLCVSVLQAANHNIVVGPLTRFYSLVRSGDLQNEEVNEALRAMTAFFALWRGAFGTTNNIDSRYRTLMTEGASNVGVRPFARTPGVEFDEESPVDAATLRVFMKSMLDQSEIGSKENWVARASRIAVYKASKPLTRLLLLAATHDTVPDEKEPGLTKPGKVGVMPLLSHEIWSDEGMVSVEHIAPQTQSEDWDVALYERDETVDRLGNLILIPQDENSALSNASWEVKRACFRILSATSPDDADEARAAAKVAGIAVPKSIATPASDDSYRPLAAGVARLDADWSVDIIDQRSIRLAETAWDRLSAWLTSS